MNSSSVTGPSTPVSFAAATATTATLGSLLASKWRLDTTLGTGGMATVYAATHKNGSRVAIKLLHAAAARDPDTVARFRNEGWLGNSVAHPGAVATLDDGETDDGTPFLVMELLEGETLHTRLSSTGALPLPDALDVIDQVLDVLVAAHERGLFHRDIKPENVFLTRGGRVKVVDFGIAECEHGTDGDEGRSRAADAITGLALGTPAFMAPEQARGRWDQVDARSDLWSVGATLYSALTGRLLRDAGSPEKALMEAMLPCPPMRVMAPALPTAVASVLDRALAFERAERFESAVAMQATLRSARAESSTAPAPNDGEDGEFALPVTHRVPPGVRALLVAIASALALVLLIGAWSRSTPVSATRGLFLPPSPTESLLRVPPPPLPEVAEIVAPRGPSAKPSAPKAPPSTSPSAPASDPMGRRF